MLLLILKKFLLRFLWSIDIINGMGCIKKRKITYIPEAQKNLIISGWLVDSKAFENIIDLFIEIDGKKYQALYGLKRTDVSFALKSIGYRNCGFRCVIPKEEFSIGEIYLINFQIKAKNNENININTSIKFTINNEEFIERNIVTTEEQEYSQYVSDILSFKYIAGTGIEIGALHAPMSFDKNKAQVLYVDRLPKEDLYLQYPEFRKYDIVGADIVDNGTELSTIVDNSYDFCISNHVLEHIEDPIKALLAWVRVIKPGGILYLSVPLPNNMHDKNRQTTTISHIINDYDLSRINKEVYEKQRYDHFLEFVQSTTNNDQSNDHFIKNETDKLIAINYSIHFHVFTEEILFQMIDFVSKMMNIQVVEFVENKPEEFILIIQKNSPI